MKRRRKKVRKRFLNKKRLTIFAVAFFVALVGLIFVLGSGGLFTGYESVEEITPVDKETGKVNFLLVGLDKYGTQTDTIMIASYDLDANSVNVLSVPRDTRMYIGNRYQKINAAYSISKNGKRNGINGTIEAVSRLTGIPVNYYIEFTFKTFRDSIDALGGVYFNVPQNMNYDDPTQDLHIHLTKGEQLLDGDKAEQLVRFRRYPMGDIDRIKVQQDFIKAVAEQKLNSGIIAKLPELYESLQSNLKSNLKLSDVSRYALNLMDLTGENIHIHSVPGWANGTDYGASYWIVDIDELKLLIQTTFGYDAENITIHSKDGSSRDKDKKVVISTPTPSQTKEPTPKPTSKPTVTPGATGIQRPTQAPSTEPKKTPTAKPTKTPEASVVPTEAPEKTPQTPQRPAANPD